MSRQMVAAHAAIACLAGIVGFVAYRLNGAGCFQADQLSGLGCSLFESQVVFLQAALPVAAVLYAVWGAILLHERANKRA
jgi:hypothetical protein